MPQIGLIAASSTSTFNPENLPQYLQIGDIDDTNDLNFLRVTTSGKNIINIVGANFLLALCKLDTAALIAAGASDLPETLLRVSDGQIEKRTQISVTKAGAGTAILYGNSIGFSPDNIARFASSSSVDARQTVKYSNFEYLLVDPTNLSRVVVTYQNGFEEDLSLEEVRGLWARQGFTEANGLVNGLLVIAGSISPVAPVKAARLVNGTGGATNVLETYNGVV